MEKKALTGITLILVLLSVSIWTFNVQRAKGSPLNLTSNYLGGISMTSENDGWIVGGLGTILHWDGSSWTVRTSPTNQSLYDVDMVTSSDGWAVGTKSTEVHWDGYSATATNGIILHWDGLQWIDASSLIYLPQPPPNVRQNLAFSAISMVDSNNGWIVGTWECYSTLPEDYRWWDSGVMLKWDGQKWSVFNTFGSIPPLKDICMLDRSTGWTVGLDNTYEGGYDNERRHDNVYRWNGVSWTGETPMSHRDVFFSVFAVSPNDVWITDPNADTHGLLHWDGHKWNEIDLGLHFEHRYPFYTFFLNRNNGWVSVGVLNGTNSDDVKYTILHWDGAEWKSSSDLLPMNVVDFDVSSENNGWAVGVKGTILRWNGNSWNVYASSYWSEPFWSQWWFWAIIAIVAIGIISSIFLIKRRKHLQEVLKSEEKITRK